MALTIALVLLGLAAAAPPAGAQEQRVVLAWLPSETTVAQLAQAGFSPGVMSAGLGTVPPAQTYLDVGQGNRVFDSLYDEPLPELKHDRLRWWRAVVERAESAPADIVPGLLSSTLAANGVPARRFEVQGASLARLSPIDANATVIAIARPSGETDAPLPIGIAGPGFEGNLTSDSTRTDGYVLATDVAPTVLDQFGIGTPGEMSGQPIRAEGQVDVAAIDSLVARLDVVSERRGPVIGLSILAWLLLAAGAAASTGGRRAREAVRLLGLSVVYLPFLLLAGAALEPGETAEALLVGIGAPSLAAISLLLLGGYGALAFASAVTVLAHALDVIVGSPLTALSLLGPNPGLGVRFYGIGNELEASLAVLVIAGTGAGLAAFAPRASRRESAAVFLLLGLLAAFVFAAGRFGADVGAAIVLPLGAAVAALAVADRSRRSLALAAIAAPLAVLALLALVDLLSGANAHLTRSVLDAGGLGDLADVAQRRLQLSVRSFTRPVLLAFLPLVLVAGALAYLGRDRLLAWVEGAPAMRAGLLGALTATAIGTLANDSGALVLVVGAAYLLVFTGFAWAESGAISEKNQVEDEKLQLRGPHV